MPPIETGPISAITAPGVRTARLGPARAPEGAAAPAAATGKTTAPASAALDPGAAPVDGDRVALIRKAIQAGRYPIIPAKVGDAMIAAGVLLRTPK